MDREGLAFVDLDWTLQFLDRVLTVWSGLMGGGGGGWVWCGVFLEDQ